MCQRDFMEHMTRLLLTDLHLPTEGIIKGLSSKGFKV